MDWMCILLVWTGSRFNSCFTFKSRQGWSVERSPNGYHASRQRTPCPNSTTKRSPEMFEHLAIPTTSTQQQVLFQGFAHGAFHLLKDLNAVQLKVEQSIATKFHKPHLSGSISRPPAPRVMWKSSTKTTHTLMTQATSWWQRKLETWPPKSEAWEYKHFPPAMSNIKI